MTVLDIVREPDTPEARLKTLGLALPKPAGAVANYAPWLISGRMLYTSGQLPWIDGKLLYKGKIGSDLTPEQGYEACQLSTLNAIAQLKSALGELSRVKQIVRLEGTLNVAAGFIDHPKALNGASDLLNNVFGPAGLHTRMIYTNPEMPFDCASLVVLLAEIKEEEAAKMSAMETRAQPDWTDAIRDDLKANAFNGRVGSVLASETDCVRVWHLTLRPGERIGFHRHVNDYLWTVLTEGRAKSRYSSGEVKVVEYLPGDTRHFKFASGEYMLHDLENVGSSLLSFVTVEFLGGANQPLPL